MNKKYSVTNLKYSNNVNGFNKFLLDLYDLYIMGYHNDNGFAYFLISTFGLNITTFHELMEYLENNDISKEEMQGYYFLFKL